MNAEWIDTALRLVAGASLGAAVYFLLAQVVHRIHSNSQAEALRTYYRQRGQVEDPGTANPGKVQISELNKTRLAFVRLGLDVSGKEAAAMYGLTVLIALPAVMVLLALQLSLLIALAGGAVLGYAVANGFVNSQWSKTRVEMEQEIPTLLRNISGILKAEPNILEALSSARQALDPEKPLAAWVETAIARLQRQGYAAFEHLMTEANQISSALVVVVFEIQRMSETGGAGYTAAFHETARNLGEILDVKGESNAVAAGSQGLAVAIILVAGATLAFVLNSPVGKSVYLSNGVFKIGLVVVIAWGAYGWTVIQQMVQEATT